MLPFKREGVRDRGRTSVTSRLYLSCLSFLFFLLIAQGTSHIIRAVVYTDTMRSRPPTTARAFRSPLQAGQTFGASESITLVLVCTLIALIALRLVRRGQAVRHLARRARVRARVAWRCCTQCASPTRVGKANPVAAVVVIVVVRHGRSSFFGVSEVIYLP